MKTLHYSITINAPVATVRDTMLDDATYRQRTSAFNSAGSRYEGNRAEGTKILFLGPDPSNPSKIGGMVSRIARNKLHELIDIEHLGEVSNGVEDTTSEKIKARQGAHEIYEFTENDGLTTVNVSLQIQEGSGFEDFMADAWPKSLEILKQLCEKK
jgi:hypothetical protein